MSDDDTQSATQSFGIGDKDDYQQAQWLSIKFAGKWRFDHTAKRWHHWNGHRWAPDETDRISNDVALAAAKASLPGSDYQGVPKEVLRKLLNRGPMANALQALASFPAYATNGDDWDADPHLMGVANGVVDLRTNTLIEHPDPSCNITKTTGVAFHPITSFAEATDRAPVFMHAMSQWTADFNEDPDPTMTAFLLLWFGASMFGFSPEQRFMLMTGIGRNGKGAMKHALLGAIGDYGAQLDANLYMRTKMGAARTNEARADLLALKGKRITFFSEPEGNRFNEELLKAHTGGDQIVARALYSNNIQTWEPTHSITFLVNDAPEVDDLGPSMAARVMVADFRQRFDGEREDKTLYDRLRSRTEREGVLAILCWAASKWYQRWNDTGTGITLPERVSDQSRAFMDRNDPVAAFIDEACVAAPGEEGRAGTMYEAYKDWHKDAGREGEPMSNNKFAAALEKKGFRKKSRNTGAYYLNVRAKSIVELATDAGDDDDE